VVSELLDIHPETIRTWERYGLVQPPQRRSGRRTFSENDFKRLEFIQRLTGEGLTVRAVLHYLKLYPCWKVDDCSDCLNCDDKTGYSKPCWRNPGCSCRASSNEDLCTNCKSRIQKKLHEMPETEPDALPERQYRNAPAPDTSLNFQSTPLEISTER